MILCCVVCGLILSILSTFPALCVCARSHAVTVITNTPAWFYAVDESAVHGDDEGDISFRSISDLMIDT
jgi:hypothetical protein